MPWRRQRLAAIRAARRAASTIPPAMTREISCGPRGAPSGPHASSVPLWLGAFASAARGEVAPAARYGLAGGECAAAVAGAEGADGHDLLPHGPPPGRGRCGAGRRRQRRAGFEQLVEEPARLVVAERRPERLLLLGRRRPVAGRF